MDKMKLQTLGGILALGALGVLCQLPMKSPNSGANGASGSGAVAGRGLSSDARKPTEFEIFGMRTDSSLDALKNAYPKIECSQEKLNPPCNEEFFPEAFKGDLAGGMIACSVAGAGMDFSDVSVEVVKCQFTPDENPDPVAITFVAGRVEQVLREFSTQKYQPNFWDATRTFTSRVGVDYKEFQNRSEIAQVQRRPEMRTVHDFRLGGGSWLQLVSGDGWASIKDALLQVRYDRQSLMPIFREKLNAYREKIRAAKKADERKTKL